MRIVPSKLRQGLRIADETLNGAVNGLPIRLVSQWASVDPEMSVSTPGQGQNLGKPPSYSYDSNKCASVNKRNKQYDPSRIDLGGHCMLTR